MADLTDALQISAAGMKVQGVRVRIIAENLANTDSLAQTPDGDPYRRKIITFENVLDRELGIHKVDVKDIGYDISEFGRRYEPGHPAADVDGYVQTTNVNSLIEMMDMRQAQRSYEANLNVITMTKTILKRTIDVLR